MINLNGDSSSSTCGGSIAQWKEHLAGSRVARPQQEVTLRKSLYLDFLIRKMRRWGMVTVETPVGPLSVESSGT